MATLLKTKRLGWAVIFALVTALALLAYFSSARYAAATAKVEHVLAVEQAVNGTVSLLKDVETGQRGYVLTGDPQFLEPYLTAQRDLPKVLARLAAVTEDDGMEASRLPELRRLVAEKLAFAEKVIVLRRDGDLTQAILLIRTLYGKEVMDRVRVIAAEMLVHEEQRLEQGKLDAHVAERRAIWGVGVASLLTISLALISLLTVNRDVAELQRTAEELAKSEEHFRLLSDNTSDLVRLLSLKGGVTYVSPSVERLLGYTVEEYLSVPPLSLMHPDELELGRSILAAIMSGAATSGSSTYRLRHKSGEFLWFEVRWTVRLDSQGQPLNLHTTGRDVTERVRAEKQLSAYAAELKGLSLRDELTELYNRRGFMEVAAQLHGLAIRDARPAALVFVDLNGMKAINDGLGHDIGDAALQDTAYVLRHVFRESDVVARLGGDEFVAFALDFEPIRLDGLRRRLREEADARVAEQDRPYRLSMSAGAAYLAVGSQGSLQELLDEADGAMYEQKNARRAAGGVTMPPPAASE